MTPSLETDRLRLRAHFLSDYEALLKLWTQPDVYRFIGGKPHTPEEAWSRLLRYAGHWEMLGFGYWIAEEKISGEFVGEVGFANYKRDVDPPLEDRPEAGWVLAPEKFGQGYATEAVKGILNWGAQNLRQKAVVCIIDPANAPSIKVAGKCGFILQVRGKYKGNETLIFQKAL